MRRDADIPEVREDASFASALDEMTRGGLGMTAVVDARRRVKGIFTDGDLRRALRSAARASEIRRVAQVMTRKPHTIRPEALAVEAVELMERHRVSALLVVNRAGQLVGALNMHDLFRAKIV